MPSSQAKLSTLKFLAGFHRESTKYAEEGKWYDGDRVRFREGKPENLRGYQKLINSEIIGTPRDLITWANNNTQKLLSTGTEQRLYIVLGDTQYDITPIASVVSIAAGTNGNFNTSVGSRLIEVSLTNHNTAIGDWIYFTSTSVKGFGAATNFAASSFGGPVFAVASVSGFQPQVVIGIYVFFVHTHAHESGTQAHPQKILSVIFYDLFYTSKTQVHAIGHNQYLHAIFSQLRCNFCGAGKVRVVQAGKIQFSCSGGAVCEYNGMGHERFTLVDVYECLFITSCFLLHK